MRIQMLNDHRQASRWSSLQAIKYVVKSDVDNHVLNNQSPNQPLFTVGDTNCVEQGCYLDFTTEGLGNSLAFPSCFDGQCLATENPYSHTRASRPFRWRTSPTCSPHIHRTALEPVAARATTQPRANSTPRSTFLIHTSVAFNR